MGKIKEQYISKTLEKSLEILKVFKNGNRLSFTQLENKLEINKTTLYRLLYTLEKYNFLRKDEQNFYELGFEVFMLSQIPTKKNMIKDISKPIMKKLVNETNLTAHLAYLENNKIFYLNKVSAGKIELHTNIGDNIPIHCTAVGKSILAFKDKENINEILDNKNLKRYTNNTICDYEQLLSHLEKVRKNKYSTDIAEHEEHFSCVAVPILNNNNEANEALSLSGLTAEINKIDLKTLVNLLNDCAKEISEKVYKQAK